MKTKKVWSEVANQMVRLFQGNGENRFRQDGGCTNKPESIILPMENVCPFSGEFRMFSALLENLSECFARLAALFRRLSKRLHSAAANFSCSWRSNVQPAYAYRIVEGFANLHLWKATDGQPMAANVPIRCLMFNSNTYEEKQ